jgi:hypothetical protein
MKKTVPRSIEGTSRVEAFSDDVIAIIICSFAKVGDWTLKTASKTAK